MSCLQESIAIVTGASRGIGKAVAVELASHGYWVVINYKSNEQAAKDTLDSVRKAGGDGELCQFDVCDADWCARELSRILACNKPIGALVNNAGIVADSLFAMMSPGDWNSVIQTTLGGFFNVTKPVIQRMIPQRAGSVVSISSVSGLIANRGQANYSAAKAGLIAASRCLASEVARLGIRVNVVAPGFIETDMTKEVPLDNVKKLIPMARVGRPEEVARVVRFLCSQDASYITGQVISPNGGMA